MRTVLSMIAFLSVAGFVATPQLEAAAPTFTCNDPALCADVARGLNYYGNYQGHDEPSLIFYSNTPRSGNSSLYYITIPVEPTVPPNQAGTGGVANYQLHAAFWFGMALCDTQSAPNYTTNCTPDSDSNIFDNSDPSASDYIGHHPGGAYMEFQFYPPGWIQTSDGGLSCDPTKWCAAMTIDSLGDDQNHLDQGGNAIENNFDCEDILQTDEYQSFAFLTLDGKPLTAPDPLGRANSLNPNTSAGDVLLMNPGDQIALNMYDTAAGLTVSIVDYSTGQTGSMTASIANGFKQVVFDPSASTCTEKPYAFHPMYSTSSEHTRLSWTAHTYNIAFSDEIGHWEFPDNDADDGFCGSSVTGIEGCEGADLDFDGLSYGLNWPGTFLGSSDKEFHPGPVEFTSPMFNGTENYSRVAFEADMPSFESTAGVVPQCNRDTGTNCTDPPTGAAFYPFFSTARSGRECVWHIGGADMPNTTDTFGGSSTAEFGSILSIFRPDTGNLYEDYRNILSNNPCPYQFFVNPMATLETVPTLEEKVTELILDPEILIEEEITMIGQGVPIEEAIGTGEALTSFLLNSLFTPSSGVAGGGVGANGGGT